MVVKIYHPSNSRGIVIDEQKRQNSLHNCAKVLCKEFGGCTVQNSMGYYLSNSGDIVQEDIKILYSNVKRLTIKQKKEIRNIAYDIKKDLAQESVMLEFGDDTEFI
jgi:hypothetical protein